MIDIEALRRTHVTGWKRLQNVTIRVATLKELLEELAYWRERGEFGTVRIGASPRIAVAADHDFQNTQPIDIVSPKNLYQAGWQSVPGSDFWFWHVRPSKDGWAGTHLTYRFGALAEISRAHAWHDIGREAEKLEP